jgi:hypothetical protein
MTHPYAGDIKQLGTLEDPHPNIINAVISFFLFLGGLYLHVVCPRSAADTITSTGKPR